MLNHSRRTVFLLAGGVAVNLLLGVAVTRGIVPHAGDTVGVAAEQPAETDAGDTAPPAAPTAPAPSAPPVTAPPTTKAASQPRSEAAAPAPTPTTAAAARAVPPPATSAAVPRLNPSDAQVLEAIQQLSARMPLFRPTGPQARQFGDMVCTAFDQGASAAQVHAGVTAAVAQVPALSVTPADADYAVRTAVQLACPGHLPKLA